MSRSSLLRVHGCGLNNHIESSTRRQFFSQSFGICSAAFMNARSASAQSNCLHHKKKKKKKKEINREGERILMKKKFLKKKKARCCHVELARPTSLIKEEIQVIGPRKLGLDA
jgi:hypothetical protein